MFISEFEIDFHRLFDGIFKVVLLFLSGVFHGKSVHFRRRMQALDAYQAHDLPLDGMVNIPIYLVDWLSTG